MIARRRVLFVLLLVLASCEKAWDAGNSRSLHRDVRALTARDFDCSMRGTTRGAVCHGKGSAKDAVALAKKLRLGPLGHGDVRLADVTSDAKWPRGATLIYGAFGRPPSLRTPEGTQFEYCVVTWSPSSGRITLFTAYAYG